MFLQSLFSLASTAAFNQLASITQVPESADTSEVGIELRAQSLPAASKGTVAVTLPVSVEFESTIAVESERSGGPLAARVRVGGDSKYFY